MDVDMEEMVDRLKEILRAEVNDPFNRGSAVTATLPTTASELSLKPNKELKNVNSATGVSTGDPYYRFDDYSIIFDDPGDPDDYPVISFPTTQSEEIEFNCQIGSSWVYPTFPTTSVSKAIISIKHITSSTDNRFLGQNIDSSTKGTEFLSTWQFDVWVEKGQSVEGPDSSHSGYYAGGKLCEYLGDQVTNAIIKNLDQLKDQGVVDAKMTLSQDRPLQEDLNCFRKTINFDFQHRREW